MIYCSDFVWQIFLEFDFELIMVSKLTRMHKRSITRWRAAHYHTDINMEDTEITVYLRKTCVWATFACSLKIAFLNSEYSCN